MVSIRVAIFLVLTAPLCALNENCAPGDESCVITGNTLLAFKEIKQKEGAQPFNFANSDVNANLHDTIASKQAEYQARQSELQAISAKIKQIQALTAGQHVSQLATDVQVQPKQPYGGAAPGADLENAATSELQEAKRLEDVRTAAEEGEKLAKLKAQAENDAALQKQKTARLFAEVAARETELAAANEEKMKQATALETAQLAWTATTAAVQTAKADLETKHANSMEAHAALATRQEIYEKNAAIAQAKRREADASGALVTGLESQLFEQQKVTKEKEAEEAAAATQLEDATAAATLACTAHQKIQEMQTNQVSELAQLEKIAGQAHAQVAKIEAEYETRKLEAGNVKQQFEQVEKKTHDSQQAADRAATEAMAQSVAATEAKGEAEAMAKATEEMARASLLQH